jgi:hypothetical protein
VGALLVGGVALGGTVFAPGTSEAQEQPSPFPSLPANPEEHPHPLFGVVHADLDLTRYDGSTFGLEFDRGLIVSITEGEIRVMRLDGQTVTLRVTEDTIVRDGLEPGSVEGLKVGDRAMFFSDPSQGDPPVAVLIRCISELGERFEGALNKVAEGA